MALNIDECIDEALADITAVAYGGAAGDLQTAFAAWVAGMFGSAGVFSDITSAPQRTVIDWWPLHLLVDVSSPPTAEEVGAVIDVVVRVLNAVKYANINTYITQAQEDDVVTLYQGTWD